MTPDAFLTLADQLAQESTEAAWRSAASRAYYAAFHTARELFADLGFVMPRDESAHRKMSYRLQNSGDAQVQAAGTQLDVLRRDRNRGDYDLHKPFSNSQALLTTQNAKHILQLLATARHQPTHTQITDAMKIYERDVLKDVTWQGP
jgi:uncharacterized protein (UPF0332 family)